MKCVKMFIDQNADGFWFVHRITESGEDRPTPWAWKSSDSAQHYVDTHDELSRS